MDPFSRRKSSSAAGGGGQRSFEKKRDLSPVADVEGEDSNEDMSEKMEKTQTQQSQRSQPGHIRWHHPFGQDASNDPQLLTHQRSSPQANMGRRMSHNIRRASVAVGEVLHKMDPLSATQGNPLGLGINETRRVSSVGYSAPQQFNARRFSRVASSVETVKVPDVAQIREDSDESLSTVVRPGMSEKQEDYIIQRLAAHDDAEMLTPFRRFLYRLCPVLVAVTIAAYS